MKWIKASEIKGMPDVAVTLMENGKVFAYDTEHNIKGLLEIIKHHPDILCLCFDKSEALKSNPPQKEGEDELWDAAADKIIACYNNMGSRKELNDELKQSFHIHKKQQ